VVLSGEGADELFGGYNSYREEVDYAFYDKIPFFIRRLVSKICSFLPEARGVNFLVRRGQVLEKKYVGVSSVFCDKEVEKVLNVKYALNNNDFTKQIFEEQEGQCKLVKKQAIDINLWFEKDILQKADRMTMANSIEGRLPFTDINVFNTAREISSEGKVTKENTKVYLREAAKKVVPNGCYKKKKLGFLVPLREWMKDDYFYNQIRVVFELPVAKELFDHDYIMKLLDDHKNEKRDNYKKVWTIYCFLIWHQEFFSQPCENIVTFHTIRGNPQVLIYKGSTKKVV